MGAKAKGEGMAPGEVLPRLQAELFMYGDCATLVTPSHNSAKKLAAAVSSNQSHSPHCLSHACGEVFGFAGFSRGI